MLISAKRVFGCYYHMTGSELQIATTLSTWCSASKGATPLSYCGLQFLQCQCANSKLVPSGSNAILIGQQMPPSALSESTC
jgi:hypothetical protein